jgi:gamma-glutamylcyclotransferase (GGCT)/AIG2-like uncharacterized protein YtfP
MKLFVYGTLIEPMIQSSVFGRRIEPIPAKLHGFELLDVHPIGAPYKTIRKKDKDTANGWILDIEETDLPRLDYYEAAPRLYVRKEVQADLNGEPVDCFTYIATPYDYDLSGTEITTTGD